MSARTEGFFAKALIGGVLVVVPLYLAILLLMKAASSLLGIVKPIAKLLPAWMPAANILAIALVLVVCFLVGAALLTPVGVSFRAQLHRAVLGRIPGYDLIRSLGERIAGRGSGDDTNNWKPALVEIEDALVPAFIVEHLPGGRFTVFVPSAPTPFGGAIYVLTATRVHPVDVPFTHAIKTISHWGVGTGAMVAAMPPAGKEQVTTTGELK
jgi:uncharacterized membrane protein